MANEENIELQDLTADELKEKANSLLEDYKTLIGAIIGGVVVLTLGIYWYSEMYQAPREEKAQVELYKVEQEFNRDSFAIVLNGRTIQGSANNMIGAVGIISEYGGTDASNIAHYYAGISSLRLGQFAAALDYLDNFSGEELMQTQAYTLMGDAASEMQDMDGALGYYQKAAGYTENVPLQAYAKYKVAKVLEQQGKKAEAVKYLQEIMDTDRQIAESLGVDKDLIRLK